MVSRSDLRNYEGMEPEEIARGEGLEIIEVDDMPRRMEDMFLLDTIVIRSGLSPEERRWRIAHCLGHHFLHEGSRRSDRVIFNPREEREADIFAGYLLGAMLSPGWVRDLYWSFEPWKLEPWELIRQLHSRFSLPSVEESRAATRV